MTDMIEIRPRGDELGRVSAEKIRQRADEFDEKMKRLGFYRETVRRTISVQVARPDMRVPDEFGSMFPKGTFEVDPGNRYIARRMMDGSLVQVEGKAEAQPGAGAPPPAPPPEAPPESPPEEPQPEEPQPAAE